jgi:hypothetical protein
MRRVLLAAVLAASSMASSWAVAQPAAKPEDADARCVAVLSIAVNNMTDEKVKVATSIAIFYFIGKFDGRATGQDLEARIRSQISGFSPDVMKAEAARCGGEFEKRTGEVSAVGAHLKSSPAG